MLASVFLGLLAASLPAGALTLEPPKKNSAEPLDAIDEYVLGEMAKKHVPGLALGVYRAGSILRAEGYGWANVETKEPVRPNTVFQIQSVTKSFTASAIMLLIDEGKLGLEDRITKYITGCPESWSNVTVRHLLTHTSGIKDFINEPTVPLDQDITAEAVVASLVQRPLNFAPGEKYTYSNTGYHLLGMIIHQVTGKPWEEVLRERIFRPLAMKDTDINSATCALPRRAAGYIWADGGLQPGMYVAPSILGYARRRHPFDGERPGALGRRIVLRQNSQAKSAGPNVGPRQVQQRQPVHLWLWLGCQGFSRASAGGPFGRACHRVPFDLPALPRRPGDGGGCWSMNAAPTRTTLACGSPDVIFRACAPARRPRNPPRPPERTQAAEPPVPPAVWDASRQWDQWPVQRIGARALSSQANENWHRYLTENLNTVVLWKARSGPQHGRGELRLVGGIGEVLGFQAKSGMATKHRAIGTLEIAHMICGIELHPGFRSLRLPSPVRSWAHAPVRTAPEICRPGAAHNCGHTLPAAV